MAAAPRSCLAARARASAPSAELRADKCGHARRTGVGAGGRSTVALGEGRRHSEQLIEHRVILPRGPAGSWTGGPW